MLPGRRLPLLGTIYGGRFPGRREGGGAWRGAKYATRQSQPNAALTKRPGRVNREIDGSAPCATGLTDRGPASQVGSISISPRDKVQTQGSTWTSAAAAGCPSPQGESSSRRGTAVPVAVARASLSALIAPWPHCVRVCASASRESGSLMAYTSTGRKQG